MGKKQKAPAPVKQMSKRQISRWQREKKMQKLLFASAGALGVIVAVLLAFGFYREFVQPPREIVARVNDRAFNMEYYVKLYSLRDYILGLQQATLQQAQATADASNKDAIQQQLQQSQFSRSLLPSQVVDQIIENELVKEYAQSQGIAVTPEEVNDYVMNQFLGPVKEGEQVDQGKRQSDFNQVYPGFLSDTGVSDAEYRDIATAELLRSKIEQTVKDAVPTQGEQVHVEMIVAPSEDEAKAAKAKVESGTAFEDVAKEVSKDASGPQGGDIGWLPKGLRGEEFDQAAFALKPGELSDPIKEGESFVILKVLDHQKDRQIIDDYRTQLQEIAAQDWMNNQKKSAKIDRYFDSEKQDWASRQVQRIRAKRSSVTL